MNSLPPITDPAFRQKLREAREARNLSQYALAKLAGIAGVMPKRYEDAADRYATLPNAATWAKLNTALFPDAPQSVAIAPHRVSGKDAAANPDQNTALENASVEAIVGELKRRGAVSVVINW